MANNCPIYLGYQGYRQATSITKQINQPRLRVGWKARTMDSPNSRKVGDLFGANEHGIQRTRRINHRFGSR